MDAAPGHPNLPSSLALGAAVAGMSACLAFEVLDPGWKRSLGVCVAVTATVALLGTVVFLQRRRA